MTSLAKCLELAGCIGCGSWVPGAACCSPTTGLLLDTACFALQEMEMAAAFNVALPVPRLNQAEQRSVLQQLGAFSGQHVSRAMARDEASES